MSFAVLVPHQDVLKYDVSEEDVSMKPDDVLQTVKFGSDVMQQMREKRNEILQTHETSAAEKSVPIVRKDYSSIRKEKTISPSPSLVQETNAIKTYAAVPKLRLLYD